ncbi:hypothetical protein M9Y10_027885 [Tritrichomonas musculus]|uniref:sn-1-specific diacylglycerol lipase n=1 Tax=Tritrichomonas musculus TaxID=1915356 RepID=A0ABR2H485_9EUKA
MKLSHSQSCRTKAEQDAEEEEEEGEEYEENNDNKKNQQKKFKRTKSLFFDPTTQVNHPLPDLIWKATFHVLPRAPELDKSKLSSNEVMDLLHCCLLSNAVYYKDGTKHLPANLCNIVIDCWKSDFYRIPYFVVDSDELDTIFIALRGSANLKDFHVDFLAAAIQYQRGHVHEGVYFTSLNIFEEIKRQVRELSLKRNKRKIILTGHSLGGAVAGMMAVLFNEEMIDLNISAVCFAPVASFSQEIWEFSHSYIKSYINYGDLVPFISYYNAYYLPKNSLPKVTYERLNRWCIKKINKHSKRPEFRLLVDTYTEPLKVPYKLIPPGDSYIIRIVDKKAATVEIQGINAPQIYFGQFLKNLSATHHSMNLYKHSIIRYSCEFFNQDPELVEYIRSRKHHHHHHHHKNNKNNKEIKNNKDNKDNKDDKNNEDNKDDKNNKDIKDDKDYNDNESDNSSDSDNDDDDDDYNYNYNVSSTPIISSNTSLTSVNQSQQASNNSIIASSNNLKS